MNKMSKIARKQKGFTLIEIAIVLVIIGLLLGGVLQGQQLIENSRVRAASNDFTGIPAAAYAYVDRYRRFPGDDGDLTALTGRGGAWANVTVAGNTDGVLAGPAVAATFTAPITEAIGFWQHSRAAGFISGNPAAATVATGLLPQNPFGGLTAVSSAAIQGIPVNVNKVCMNNLSGTAAQALDTRLDDGSPVTGNFRATPGAAPAAAAMTPATAVYVSDALYTVCSRF